MCYDHSFASAAIRGFAIVVIALTLLCASIAHRMSNTNHPVTPASAGHSSTTGFASTKRSRDDDDDAAEESFDVTAIQAKYGEEFDHALVLMSKLLEIESVADSFPESEEKHQIFEVLGETEKALAKLRSQSIRERTRIVELEAERRAMAYECQNLMFANMKKRPKGADHSNAQMMEHEAQLSEIARLKEQVEELTSERDALKSDRDKKAEHLSAALLVLDELSSSP